MSIILLIFTGLTAGLLAGLLGIGGGLVIVPVIAFMTQFHFGLPTGEAMHVAIATSIASILLTAIGSILAHHRRGAVRWRFLLHYAPWVAAGAWLASFSVAFLSGILDGRLMVGLFVAFAVITAVKMWRKKAAASQAQQQPLTFTWPGDAVIGLLIGHVSALLGIGGGSMNAPYFNARGVPMPTAVGTAAACGYPLALAAALGFAWQVSTPATDAGLQLQGMIYWPAALVIGLTGLLAAPFGARLAHWLPEPVLRRVFAALLMILAIRMLWL